MVTCKSGSKKQQTTIPSQTPLIRMDTEGGIESVRINTVPILNRLNLEKIVRASFSQGQSKLSVINEVSILSGCL